MTHVNVMAGWGDRRSLPEGQALGKGCAGLYALATTAPRLGSVWPPQAGLPVHARISLRGSAVKGRFPRWLWHDVAVALDQGGATLVLIHFRATGANRLIKEEARSEEHTSELQSRENLVCRLLLEKKKKKARS